MNLKFSMNEAVKIVSTGQKGIIKACEYKLIVDKYDKREIERYLVQPMGDAIATQYDVSKLAPWIEVDPKTEKIIDKLLIDIHLDCGNLAAVSEMVNGKEA